MTERLIQEITLLRERFTDLVHGLRGEWILVPEHPLLEGRFNRKRTPLLVALPTEYPSIAPDDFFVHGQLRLADGSMPPGLNQGPQSSAGASPLGGDWAWFSWHPVRWQPAGEVRTGDNLLTFLRGATACLEGREQT
jgi:hypothetical protein